MSPDPRDISVRAWEGGTRISIEMPFQVGGVMVRLETEDGKVDQSEISLDHLPVEKRSQFWLSKHEIAGNRFTFEVDGRSFIGLNLVTLRLRRVGQPDWFQLSNARNDRYAFPLKGGAPNDDVGPRLDQIDTWLSHCYAPTVWDQALGEALKGRWSELIKDTGAKPGGMSRLLLLAFKDEQLDWLPMLHVIQLIPTLLAEPSMSFHAFSGSSGSDRILRILSDASVNRVRDLNLNPMALLGFPNARTAESAGERLKNFKPSYLPAIFSTLAEKPKEWLGIDALGPDHAATAVTLLRDRIEAYEILGAGEMEGRMSLRSANLNRVASSLRDPRLEDRCISSKDEDDGSIHMIEQALVAFAFASRRGPEAVLDRVNQTSAKLGESQQAVLASIGEMIRLGRELCVFHMIAAELELRSAS